MPKRVPKIRFKKYTDEWKEDMLSEFLEVSKEKNFLEEYDKTDVLSVSGECGIVNQIEHKGRSFAGASVANYGIVDTGDVVYTKSPLLNTPYGIIKTNKGKPGIVSTLYAVYKPKESVEPNFIECYFEQNARINNYLKPLVNKGAKNDMKVTDENALKGIVVFPKKEEQREIEIYVNSLEKLINKVQIQYEKTIIIKKILIQNLYTSEKNALPAIRFKNYSGSWNIFNLKKFANKVKEKNKQKIYSETYTNSAEFGIISQQEFFDHEITNKNNLDNYYVVKENDFVYNPRISTIAPVGPINRNKLGRSGIVSPLYTVFTTNDINNTFLEYFFKSNYWHNYMYKNGDSGARHDRFSIKDEILMNMSIACPQEKEQIQIGDFLSKIDNLISLYKQKLEKLKQVKESFIQQMFVN